MKIKELYEKNKYKTDKFDGHHYMDTYEALFSGRTDKVFNVLEVGIQQGESLLLWRDLFPNANVYGVDIDLDQLIIDRNENRIHLAEGNAYTDEFIDQHYHNIKFDVIIDDGSHLIEHMMFFVRKYSHLLKDNGILVVEDIAHFPHAEQLKNALPQNLQSRAEVVDLRPVNNRWDDIMLVVK